MKDKFLYFPCIKHSVIAVFLFFISCNKEGAGCFDKAGKAITVTVDVPYFTSIDVASNVDVKLLTSGANRVEVSTGENLISGISLVVLDSVLRIENLNSCFFSKGYINPLVSIRNVNMERIVQHGYGRIYSVDTLKTDNLSIQVEDASGEVDLMIEADYINVVTNNIGPIILKGGVRKLDVGIYWSDGVFYGKDLAVQECRLNHNGSNRVELNVTNSLTGSINSIGSVYLFGQKPSAINVDITDAGKIIERY